LDADAIGGTCGAPPDDAGAAISGAAGAIGGAVVAADDAAAPDASGVGGGNADSPRENAAAGDVGPDAVAVAEPADPAGDSPVPSPEGIPPKPPMPPLADNEDEPVDSPPPPKPGNPPGERNGEGGGATGVVGVSVAAGGTAAGRSPPKLVELAAFPVSPTPVCP